MSIDTRVELTRTKNINPIRTPFRERETTETTGLKSTRGFIGTIGAGLSKIIPPVMSLSVSGSYSHSRETSSTSTTKKYSSRITQRDERGRVSWGYSVDDPNEREGGLQLLDSNLPTVEFMFLGNVEEAAPPPPPPTHYIEIASCWSLSDSQAESGMPSWFQFQGAHKSTPYYNICQVLALEIPSDLEKSSSYMADLDIGPPCDYVTSRLQLSGQKVKRQGSLKVVSGMYACGGSSAAGISAIAGESSLHSRLEVIY